MTGLTETRQTFSNKGAGEVCSRTFQDGLLQWREILVEDRALPIEGHPVVSRVNIRSRLQPASDFTLALKPLAFVNKPAMGQPPLNFPSNICRRAA